MAGSRHCLFCKKKLSIFKRLVGSEFCSGSDQSAYAHQQQEMFLARLRIRDQFVADHPMPNSPLGASRDVTAIEPISFSSFIKC